MVDGDKTINRVVNDFVDGHQCCFFVKGPEGAGGKSTTAEFNKLFLVPVTGF